VHMGKYNVVFKCGHEEEVSLFGKYKDRNARIQWYERECDCSKCRTEALRKKMATDHNEVRMHYRKYKEEYSECKTLRNSYDDTTRTIVVFVPKMTDAPP
jgi:hypothetical protein